MEPHVRFLAPTVPVYAFDAGPGPVALVEAAIHGDEIAGAHALQEWLEEGVRIRKGRLFVCPVMNPRAYRARQRAAPGGLDMNRCFPGEAGAKEPEKRLARAFMDFVVAERPALVVTLHESQKRYKPTVKPSFGQTIVYGVDPMPPCVGRVVDAMNRELRDEEERWAPQSYPVPTSSTEVIVDATGCVGLCIETWMGFPERRRIEMQRRVVDLLLADFGIA